MESLFFFPVQLEYLALIRRNWIKKNYLVWLVVWKWCNSVDKPYILFHTHSFSRKVKSFSRKVKSFQPLKTHRKNRKNWVLNSFKNKKSPQVTTSHPSVKTNVHWVLNYQKSNAIVRARTLLLKFDRDRLRSVSALD